MRKHQPKRRNSHYQSRWNVSSQKRSLSWAFLVVLMLVEGLVRIPLVKSLPAVKPAHETTWASPTALHPESVVANIPRGGASAAVGGPLGMVLGMLQHIVHALEMAKEFLVSEVFVDWVKNNAVRIIKLLAAILFMGEILAYLGLLGDPGEGLYKFATESNREVQSFFRRNIRTLGLGPNGFIRHRLDEFVSEVREMSRKRKFALAVTIGCTSIPFLLYLTRWTVTFTVILLVVLELCAVVGLIGDPGEGLRDWVEEHEPMMRQAKRSFHEARMVLRKKLALHELAQAAFDAVRRDKAFWSGLIIGGGAGLFFDYEGSAKMTTTSTTETTG